jgi:hypothetical protein
METKLSGDVSSERWSTQIKVFSLSVSTPDYQGQGEGMRCWLAQSVDLHKHGRQHQGQVHLPINVISADSNMFRLLIICNLLPTSKLVIKVLLLYKNDCDLSCPCVPETEST